MAHHNTASRGTRILGISALVTGTLCVAYAFWFSGADVELGNTVRILYIHVPTVSVAYLCMIVNAVCSAVYLWRRTAFPDLLAAATGELGTVLLGLTLVTGALWGRSTWGAYWSWGDPRLTSTLLLFLMYLGYVTVRNIPAPRAARGTRSAVVGIVSALLIYPVHMSTTWWNSLHQGGTIGAPGESKIHGAQEFAFYLGFITFLLLAAWLTMHRFRVAWLADQVADTEFETALVDRRSEGDIPPVAEAAR
ncbi:MAG: cytochrome c biogenesis protein CcsA [Acidimicrobiales bacterium]